MELARAAPNGLVARTTAPRFLPQRCRPPSLPACLLVCLFAIPRRGRIRGKENEEREGGLHKKRTRRLFAPPPLLPGVTVTFRRYFARFCRDCLCYATQLASLSVDARSPPSQTFFCSRVHSFPVTFFRFAFCHVSFV